MTDPWAPVDVGEWAPVTADVDTPSAARIYDYFLGGKDNYSVDREVAESMFAFDPETHRAAQENRAFLTRAVRFLAEAGIRQFIDVGSGLPTRSNVHEVVREVLPDACVVYVDHEPITVAHSREMLSGLDGATAIQADARRPAEILDHRRVRNLIDFEQPVAVLLVALLHMVPPEADPAGIVARFREVMVPGSYLALSHLSGDYKSRETVAGWEEASRRMAEPLTLRAATQVRPFFDGFELVEPGLVEGAKWRPDIPSPMQSPATRWILAGVGRKS